MFTTIEIYDDRIVQTDQQSAELYSYSEAEWVAEVRFGDSVAKILVNGEMRILVGEVVTVRSASHLEEMGVTDDASLNKLLESEDVEVINNPWWEVHDDGVEHDLDAIVCDTALEAISEAIKLVINKEVSTKGETKCIS